MTTDALSRRIRELLASRGFLDGYSYDAQVLALLEELVARGALAGDEVDWVTRESRSAALEAWSRRAA